MEIRSKQVSIIGGAGYVGLVTGVGLAALGYDVVCADANEARIAGLREGRPPIHESGIEPLLNDAIREGHLRFTTSLTEAVRHGQFVFIAVGTPSRDDGQADLSQVIQVAEELGECIDTYKVVVVKSTVPVGTVELVRSVLSRRNREGRDFDIVSNPEFLREGRGLQDFFDPDRVVIGTSSERARQLMSDLYGPIIGRHALPGISSNGDRPPVPVVETDVASAQMIKYAANAFLAMRISFINEVAGICERVGADVREVARGLGYDPRIGLAYLEAGLGFGGPCLEKDLQALLRLAEETKYEPRLLRAVLERNDQQIRELVGKVKELVGYLLYKRIVAVFGLAFKGGTNDVRNSVALRLIDSLEREGAIVHSYDPMAISDAAAARPQGVYMHDSYEAVEGADVLIIATDWPEFRQLNYEAIKARMAQPCIVDGRNLLDGGHMRALGFRYLGVGTP